MNKEYTIIGNFDLKSGVLRISDPSYDKNVLSAQVLDNCRTGEWEAAACYIPDGWGHRVSILAARNVASGAKFSMLDNIDEGSAELEDFDDLIGVDAGMAGIFDDSVYGLDSAFKGWPEPVTQFSNLPGAKWFGHCCDALDNSDQAGIFPFGVVSHSGFGDGAYEGFYHTGEDGKIDLVAVVFVYDDEV